jgi:hypothetical protein
MADRVLVISLGVAAVVVVIAFLALLALLALWTELRKVRRAADVLGSGGLHGLDQVLREQGLELRRLGDRLSELERRQQQDEERLAAAIRHVSVVRFNPFAESGGDQSFAVAWLDDAGTGLVLTGLHNRVEMRVFAKPVEGGASRYPLSDEEAQAIKAAFESGANATAR